MKILIRLIKLITFIPLVIFNIFLVLFTMIFIFPMAYVIKGPNDFEDNFFSNTAIKLGRKLDNWFKE